MNRFIALAGATAIALVTSSAWANSNSWEPTVVIGGSVGIQGANIEAENGSDIDSETGWLAALQVGLDVTRDITVLAELNYGEADFEVLNVDIESESLTGFAIGQYRFPIAGPIRPYLAAGVGVGRFELDVLEGSDTALGLRGGGGIDFAVGQATSIFVEANYERYFGLEILNNDVDVDRFAGRIGVNRRF